jgi:hypothetical protein
MDFSESCHPGEGRDPENLMSLWIPAFAGMTVLQMSLVVSGTE